MESVVTVNLPVVFEVPQTSVWSDSFGGASRQLLDKLNKEAKPNARLFLDRTNLDAFKAYQETGLLRADLRFARAPSRADWGISFHQRF